MNSPDRWRERAQPEPVKAGQSGTAPGVARHLPLVNPERARLRVGPARSRNGVVGGTLFEEQDQAARHLTGARRGGQPVPGLGGAGRRYSLAACRIAWMSATA